MRSPEDIKKCLIESVNEYQKAVSSALDDEDYANQKCLEYDLEVEDGFPAYRFEEYVDNLIWNLMDGASKELRWSIAEMNDFCCENCLN